MSSLVGRRLAEVRGEGRELFETTLHAPLAADLAELGRCVTRFKAAVSAANDRGADIKFLAVLHASGRRGGGPHWHLAIHSSRPASEVKALVATAWGEATGSLPSRVHFAPMRSAVGYAKYLFGDTAEGKAFPQVLARFGAKAHFGNHFFGVGGIKAARKALWVELHGKGVATDGRGAASVSGDVPPPASSSALPDGPIRPKAAPIEREPEPPPSRMAAKATDRHHDGGGTHPGAVEPARPPRLRRDGPKVGTDVGLGARWRLPGQRHRAAVAQHAARRLGRSSRTAPKPRSRPRWGSGRPRPRRRPGGPPGRSLALAWPRPPP